MSDRHEVTEEHAPKFLEWIAKRGGVAVWPSVDLSDPGVSMSSPALTPEGKPTPKPHWKLAAEPSRVITSASEIDVVTWKEVKHEEVLNDRSRSVDEDCRRLQRVRHLDTV